MITIFCICPKGYNVGNEAIHLGLRHILYKAFKQIVNLISIPAVAHYESEAKAGLTPQTIHEINQYGHGVIIGGGNLYENGELAVNLNSLLALAPPLLLFSLSHGRIYNRRLELVDRTDAMPVKTVKALNDRANYSLARDQATLDFLHGIGCTKAQLGGCPTANLSQMVDQLPRLPGEKPTGVLLSVRNPSLMNIPLNLQARVFADVAQLIKTLQALKLGDVRLLCHDHRDIPFAATFGEAEYVYTGDVYSYLALLRSCSLSVSFRLHATLPCLSFGIPSLKISYDERAMSLMQTLGLEAWNLNYVTCSNVAEEIVTRIHCLDQLLSTLDTARGRWQHLYERNIAVFEQFAGDVERFRRQC